MVTLISQDLSEFALHARAILGLPIGHISQYGPSASAVVLREGQSSNLGYTGLAEALQLVPGAQLRLFGKPEINGRRRLGVALVKAPSVEQAIEQAIAVAAAVQVQF
jgi:phosphoribosylglycinamide formyltransferase 2